MSALPISTCSAADCRAPVEHGGLCHTHSERMRVYGTTERAGKLRCTVCRSAAHDKRRCPERVVLEDGYQRCPKCGGHDDGGRMFHGLLCEYGRHRLRERECLRCSKRFESEGPHHRMCTDCRTCDAADPPLLSVADRGKVDRYLRSRGYVGPREYFGRGREV